MLNIGDNVRVRFNLSKINGMNEFVQKTKTANPQATSENYPIGLAYGQIIGKGYNRTTPRQLSPYAVVQFAKQQLVCGCYDVSGTAMAISLEEGPDWYGARIVDDNGSVYAESSKLY